MISRHNRRRGGVGSRNQPRMGKDQKRETINKPTVHETTRAKTEKTMRD